MVGVTKSNIIFWNRNKIKIEKQLKGSEIIVASNSKTATIVSKFDDKTVLTQYKLPSFTKIKSVTAKKRLKKHISVPFSIVQAN